MHIMGLGTSRKPYFIWGESPTIWGRYRVSKKIKISIFSPLATFLDFGPLIFVYSDRRGHCPRNIKNLRMGNSRNSNKLRSKFFEGVTLLEFAPLKGAYPPMDRCILQYYGPQQKHFLLEGNRPPFGGDMGFQKKFYRPNFGEIFSELREIPTCQNLIISGSYVVL